MVLKIRQKLTIALISFVLFPLAISLGINFFHTKQALVERVGERLQMIAELSLNEYNELLFYSLSALNSWSKEFAHYSISQDKETINQRLEAHFQSYDIFENIVLATPQGEIIASADGELTSQNLSSREWFSLASTSQNRLAHDITFEPTLNSIVFPLSVPVIEQGEVLKIKAVIIAFLSWDAIIGILDQLELGDDAGSTNNYAVFVDANGSIIAGPDHLLDDIKHSIGNNLSANFAAYQSIALEQQKTSGYLSAQIEQQAFELGFANSGALNREMYFNGAAVVVQSRDLAFQSISELQQKLISLGGIFLLLGVLLAWKFARDIAKPLVQLKNAAENITVGVWSEVNISRSDEIGDLGNSFNVMSNQLQQALETTTEAMKKAQAAESTKSEFLATMSHEIRTPMNAINGFADILSLEQLSSSQSDYVQRIKIASHSLLTIINDILDLSKIEAGMLDINPIDFELMHVLEDQLAVFGQQINKKSLEMVIDYDFTIPALVHGDDIRLAQVITNLVSNAVKFTSSGQIVLSAKLKQQTRENIIIEFSVADTGIGISQEYLTQIYDAFTQADSSTTRQYGGTGLGMSITKHLIDKMGGKISVESEVGVGTCFTFNTVLGLATKSKPALKYKTFSANNKSTNKVVLAYDNSDALSVIKQQLEHCCTEVFVAADSESLATVITEKLPNLVILDSCLLSELSKQTIEAIRQLTPKHHFDIVLVTNVMFEGSDLASEQLGVDGIIEKPLRFVDVEKLALWFENTETLVQPTITTEDDFKRLNASKILVVDDQETNQQLANIILQKEGADVYLANDGLEAIEMAQTTLYDLILMDLQMPNIGGIEATQKIRSDAQSLSQHTPIIALTAKAMAEDKVICHKAGMNGFVSKPIDATLLKQTMVQLLPEKSARPETPQQNPKQSLINSKSDSLIGRSDTSDCHDFIDVKKGISRWQDDEKLYWSMLEDFYKRKYKLIAEIKQLITDKQFEQAYPLIHDIHGLSGNLCLTRVYQSAKAIELMLADPQSKTVAQAKLEAQMNQLIVAFEQFADWLLRHNSLNKKVQQSDNASLPTKTLSDEALLKTCQHLVSLLKQADIEAIDIFSKINQQWANQINIKNDLRNMASQIESYNFENALSLFLTISNKMNLNLGIDDV